MTAQLDDTVPPSSTQTVVVKASQEEVSPGNYILLINTDDATMPEVKVPVKAGLPVPSRRREVERPAPASPDKTEHATPAGDPVPTPAVKKMKGQTAEP